MEGKRFFAGLYTSSFYSSDLGFNFTRVEKNGGALYFYMDDKIIFRVPADNWVFKFMIVSDGVILFSLKKKGLKE